VPVATLERTLGPFGASGIGFAAMLGAGAFWVWGPVVERAGAFLLAAIMIAGVMAVLNALSMAQLAFLAPVSGGAYSYARRHVSPMAGFMAGWFFLSGKTASAAAIAVIAAGYLSPDNSRVIAPVMIAVFAAINITGIRSTAALGAGVALVVIGLLVSVSAVAPWSAGELGVAPDTSVYSVWQAAGLMFFAFAGYARMATLGGEVKNPTVVLPRVIVGTLVAVIILYAFLGTALLSTLGFDGLVGSATPVADSVPEEWRGVIIVVAVAASLGSLATILAGLSRTSMAMALEGDLPPRLGVVWGRTASPAVAEITMASVAIVISVVLDPLWLVGISSTTVLSYYALAHLAAARLPSQDRRLPRVVSWLGLVGCVALVATLPWLPLLTGVCVALVGVGVWFLVIRPKHRSG
jgi:APA family basic amino acid/polyamine antiporter